MMCLDFRLTIYVGSKCTFKKKPGKAEWVKLSKLSCFKKFESNISSCRFFAGFQNIIKWLNLNKQNTSYSLSKITLSLSLLLCVSRVTLRPHIFNFVQCRARGVQVFINIVLWELIIPRRWLFTTSSFCVGVPLTTLQSVSVFCETSFCFISHLLFTVM